MEARKIVIVSTRDQKKSVLMSAATTLSELKRDLSANGINYRDMTFYEGISRTELKDDRAVLPHDVPYKGTTTNELVFMLTNTNKKIRSGAMSRAEAYAEIKARGLQGKCREVYGDNFTRLSTGKLLSLIEKETTKEAAVPVVETTDKQPECVCGGVVAAFKQLLHILNSNDTLEDTEMDCVLNTLMNVKETETCECTKDHALPYSNDEIDRMFDFVR